MFRDAGWDRVYEAVAVSVSQGGVFWGGGGGGLLVDADVVGVSPVGDAAVFVAPVVGFDDVFTVVLSTPAKTVFAAVAVLAGVVPDCGVVAEVVAGACCAAAAGPGLGADADDGAGVEGGGGDGGADADDATGDFVAGDDGV